MAKFLILVFGLILVVFGFYSLKTDNVESPISSAQAEEPIEVINDWFPRLGSENFGFNKDLTALSAILVDYETGEVIYQKNMHTKLPAASTIKIMTALVGLENSKLSDIFLVSKKAAEVGEDTMGLSEGEKVNFEKLLYGLMLPSGNDAAVTVAENIAGSEDKFVVKMNRKAKELGMENTKFINASGLDVDGEEQYSSAFDLAVLARFTWEKYSIFRKVSATDHIAFEATNNHKFFALYNQTNLLTTYPGVKGIKPGFTWEAGYCLVTYAENDGKKLIGVILNSQDRRNEMKELLDFGFAFYNISISHPTLD